MKKYIIALITSTGMFAGLNTAEAGGGCFTPPCYTPPVCTPCPTLVYKVKTIQIDVCHHKLLAYDHCGNPYHYCVTIYTFKDIFSDGTCRIWKKTVRS